MEHYLMSAFALNEVICMGLARRTLAKHFLPWSNRWNGIHAVRARQEIMSHEETYIGRWCGTQRTLFKKGDLPKHRIEQLESYDFIWDFIDHRWQCRVGH